VVKSPVIISYINRANICITVLRSNKPTGAMICCRGDCMDSGARNAVQALVAARTEQLSKTVANLERSHDVTLEALGDALRLKDPATQAHSRRVTAFAICIARAMRQNADQMRTVARAAFLHDSGNLAVPGMILRKPSGLAPDEVKIMRTHCLQGYELVKKIPFLTEAAEIVYAYHERFDVERLPTRSRRRGYSFRSTHRRAFCGCEYQNPDPSLILMGAPLAEWGALCLILTLRFRRSKLDVAPLPEESSSVGVRGAA
jgi:hypothetical protein